MTSPARPFPNSTGGSLTVNGTLTVNSGGIIADGGDQDFDGNTAVDDFQVRHNAVLCGAAANLGAFGDEGDVQQTIAGAAADAATTQLLANSIRTILLAHNIVKP